MAGFTLKMLMDWAGPRVFHEAQNLFDRGCVRELDYQHPQARGVLAWSNREIRTGFQLLRDGTVESRCPCRDNTERGIICAHVIALGIALVRRQADPEREQKKIEEIRRAERMAHYDSSVYLPRAPAGTPGAVPARLRLILPSAWQAQGPEGPFALRCRIETGGALKKPDEIAHAAPLAFTPNEENLLFVLEDICGGPLTDKLTIPGADFHNILNLLPGTDILRAEEGDTPVTVHAAFMPSQLHLDLDRENGELILTLHTALPFLKAGEFPVYVVNGRHGWSFGADNFWPMDKMLPDPLRPLYRAPVIIPRPGVPRFLETEWLVLTQLLPTVSEITPDLFTLEPADPQFRLIIRGSPASLSAVLHAEYGEHRLVAGKPEPHGHFALPDPDDLWRYLVRNPGSEQRALERLRRDGFIGERGDELTPIVGAREVLNFMARRLPTLRRKGWKVEVEGRIHSFLEQAVSVTPVVHIESATGANWFEVGFSFEDTAGASISEAEIQRALRKGEAYIEKNAKVLLIDADAVEAMQTIFHDCASGEGSAPGRFRLASIYAAYVKSSLDALDGVDVEADKAWLGQAGRIAKPRALPAVPIEPRLAGIMRPYQQEGVNWLRFLEECGFCGILADEMGLGKTLQTLVWLTLQRALPAAQGRPALIVCPSSLVENWAEEAARFTPQLRVMMIAGADRHERWSEIRQADVVITSYALLRRDVDRYAGQELSVAILDEAQHIKNRSTQNAIAAKRIKAHNRLVLTGTPIENGVADLWSIMDFLMPGYLGGPEHFRRHYGQVIAQGGPEAEQAQTRLKRKLQPFLLRRLKRTVARELPPKIERLAHCTLSPDQQLVYWKYLEQSQRQVQEVVNREGFSRARIEILKTLLRLRQVCCHLELLKLPDLQAARPSAKLEMFFELLDEALDGGHRILVFSQFVSMLTILRRELDQRQVPYCYLDGATAERLKIVHEFNTNRAIPVFLISLKAGGTGLNLTGADMVIHFDPWWNPAVEDQATDRAYRIGQRRTVYSIKLIARGTVEEKVLALQRKKQSVIDAALTTTDEQVMQKLTWDDVKEILSL